MTLGNQVQAAFHGRRDGLVGLALVRFGNRIGAQALSGFQRMRQRLDAIGIDGLHAVDQAEDAVQGSGGVWQFALTQAQPSQVCDLFHLGAFKRHRVLL